LLKAGFNHDERYRALKQLVADQLLTNNGTVRAAADKGERTPLSPMQAARNTALHPLLRHVEGMARRNGFTIDLASDKPIDMIQLDRALKASGADIDVRMSIKTGLFQLGMIEA
jgi:hypothetical protein